MIRLKSLTKKFGDHAVLDNVSLDIQAGERVALLGLNGSGKTTLLRSLLGLVDFEGQVEIGGYDVARDGVEARRLVGYVPQRPPLFDMSVREMIGLFAGMRGVASGDVSEQLTHLGLDLEQDSDKRFSELSGGMTQKVLVGLALAQQTSVLLLDEPTANLDPRARRDLLRLVGGISRDVTIVMASHRLADVQAVAERLIVLDSGGVRFDGSVEELRVRTGLGRTLWLTLERRDQAFDFLEASYGQDVLRRNGAAVGVSLERCNPGEVVSGLRDRGLSVDDVWTELPSLTEMLESLVERGSDSDSEVRS